MRTYFRCLLLLICISTFAQEPAPITEPEPKTNAGFKPVTLRLESLDKAKSFTLIAYGDTRFTDSNEKSASNPRVRQTLVAKIAQEKPAAVIISGDLPWHGGDKNDWQQFESETSPWRDAHIHVYPALGNHELNGGEKTGLGFWWEHFPELKGARWYSVRLGNCLLFALDTNSKLGTGSPQSDWLKAQLSSVPADVDYVLFSMHHPAYTDSHPTLTGGHSARSQEQEFGAMLEKLQPTMHARFLVIAGHVHNYERFEHNGVVYLTSGGGGAKPYLFDRSANAQFKSEKTPNYHFVKLNINGGTLSAQMFRWEDDDKGGTFTERDTFTLVAGKKENVGK